MVVFRLVSGTGEGMSGKGKSGSGGNVEGSKERKGPLWYGQKAMG